MGPVLLLSPARVGPKMAGPAVRFFEFAKALSAAGLPVGLGSPEPAAPGFASAEGFELFAYDRFSLPARLKEARAVVVQGMVLARHRFIKRAGRPLVVDLYDPIFLEMLSQTEAEGSKAHNFNLAQIIESVRAGDFFLCASKKQRHLWLGFLAGCNRLNPLTFQDDPSLDRLLAIVPFGLPPARPQKTGPGLSRLKEIEPGDQVVLWNGGVWDWLEPEPLIEAVGRLAPENKSLKLVFMGVRNPDAALAESRALGRARDLVKRLNLGQRVIFNDWVPYQERANWLLEAQVGACLYPAGLETDYSFRTRLLDCIWAGLPVLCSGGDDLSRVVAREDLGEVVADHHPATVAQALARLLTDSRRRQAIGLKTARVAADMTWPRVVEPLVEFLRAPHLAADKEGRFPLCPSPRRGLKYYGQRLKDHWRAGTIIPALTAGWKVRSGR